MNKNQRNEQNITSFIVLNTNYYLLTTLSVLTILFFLLPSVVSAQNKPQPGQVFKDGGMVMTCLAAVATPGCETDPGHCVALSGGGFVPNQNIEIWRSTDGTWSCATDFYGASTCGGGQTTGDQFKIFNKDVRAGSITMSPIANKLQLSPVRSYTPTAQDHVFFGVQVVDVKSNPAEGRAQKLSQFFPKIGKESKCVNIHWDPFGIVFDATTLEPIPGASVTLLNAQKVVVPSSPGIINPQRTGEALDQKNSAKGWLENGFFNFLVAPGNYYLRPQATGFEFPVDAATFSKLQSSPYVNIYKDADTKIEEVAGKVVRADIGMTPAKGTKPTNNPPVVKISHVLQYCVNNVCYQTIDGRCSHINCTVSAYSGTKLLKQTRVTNTGVFTMVLQSSNIDPHSKLTFQGEKIPLRLTNRKGLLSYLIDRFISAVIPTINAEDELKGPITSVDPVPAYIEGYAYDTKGGLVPEAKVEIVMEGMGNRSVITTQADKSGFVRIPHFFVPPTGYSLVLYDKNNNRLTTLKPSAFIAQNKTYYAKNNINPLQPTNVDDLVNSTYSAVVERPKQVPFTKSGIAQEGKANSKYEIRNSKVDKNVIAKQSSSGSSILFFVATIFFVVVLGAIGFVILRLRKKENQIE